MKKNHHPIYHLGKMYDAMMFFKPVSIKNYKDSHQFSCKIQVLTYLVCRANITLLHFIIANMIG